jgi:hypothetical protein
VAWFTVEGGSEGTRPSCKRTVSGSNPLTGSHPRGLDLRIRSWCHLSVGYHGRRKLCGGLRGSWSGSLSSACCRSRFGCVSETYAAYGPGKCGRGGVWSAVTCRLEALAHRGFLDRKCAGWRLLPCLEIVLTHDAGLVSVFGTSADIMVPQNPCNSRFRGIDSTDNP